MIWAGSSRPMPPARRRQARFGGGDEGRQRHDPTAPADGARRGSAARGRRPRGCDVDDDQVAKVGQAGPDAFHLGQQAAIDDEDRRLGVVDDIGDLLALEAGVDGAGDGAERPDREVGPDEVGTVEEEEADPISALDAEAGERPGRGADAPSQLGVRERLARLRPDEERRLAEDGHPLLDEGAEAGVTRLGRAAQAGLDHRSRILGRGVIAGSMVASRRASPPPPPGPTRRGRGGGRRGHARCLQPGRGRRAVTDAGRLRWDLAGAPESRA